MKAKKSASYNGFKFINVVERFYLLFILVFIVLVFSPVLGGSFLELDDTPAIVNNPVVHDFDLALKTLRLNIISNSILYNVFSANPLYFHLFALFLHSFNVYLVFLILKESFSKKIAYTSSILFAVHPLVCEAVCWISGNAYLLKDLFTFLPLLFFIKYKKYLQKKYIILSLLTYSIYIAFMTTPWAIVTPVIIFTYDYLILGFVGEMKGKPFKIDVDQTSSKKSNQNFIKKHLVFGLYLIPLVFYLTFSFFGQVENRIQNLNVDRIEQNSPSKFVLLSGTIEKAVSKVVFPINVDIAPYFFNPNFYGYLEVFLTYLVVGGLIYFAYKKDKLIFGFVILFFVAALPTLTPIKLAVNYADRYFYLSTAFFTTIVAILLDKPDKKEVAEIKRVLFYILLLVYVLRTFIRAFDWRSDLSLWMYSYRIDPRNIEVLNALGTYHYKRDNLEEALRFYKEALDVYKFNPIVIHNLGLVHLKAGNIEAAKLIFLDSLQIEPRMYESYARLAQIYAFEGDVNKAVEYLKMSIQINPNYELAKNELQKLGY